MGSDFQDLTLRKRSGKRQKRDGKVTETQRQDNNRDSPTNKKTEITKKNISNNVLRTFFAFVGVSYQTSYLQGE